MTHPASLANGRYILVSPLGEGGMATVYRAFDQRLQVWRAIKVLAPQYATKPKLRARFETEAQTMALLEHKNIVRVYDVGTEGPCPYIVMELVSGGSLVDWLEAHGPMPPRMAVEVTLQFAEGIIAAHKKGIIHRDIKPHNVMVTEDGVCRVTDFGIARVGDTDNSMTKTGAVMGTWGYMAPEQRTNAKGVDARADVYAVAATLYTLLVDKMPMDLFAADRDDSMMEGVPEELLDILIKGTEYRREDRYESVEAFCDALREVLPKLDPIPEDTPPLARDPGPPPPPPDPVAFAPTPTPVPGARVGGTFYEQGGGGTILPGGAFQEAYNPTISPATAPDGTLPPGATMAPMAGSSTGGVAQSREVWRPGTIAPTDPGDRGGRRWVALVGVAVVGLVVLFGLSAAVVAVVMNGRGVTEPATDPVVQTDPVVAPEPVAPQPERPDTGIEVADAPQPTPEPEPVRPSPAPEPVRPHPAPEPVRPAPAPQPVVPTPRPVPTSPAPATTVVVTRTEPGSATVTPVPAPAPQPATPQCLNVTAPTSVSVGGVVAFRANLCNEDGTAVTVRFRPRGSPAWETRAMPLRLGAHTQTLQVTDRFATGIEYYVIAGDQAYGSPGNPKVIAVGG